MLTEQEKRAITETGVIPPSRLASLVFALNAQADDARMAASREPRDSQLGAALRGKSLAYRDAAIMLRQVMNGSALHPRSYSTAKQRARDAHARRKRVSEDDTVVIEEVPGSHVYTRVPISSLPASDLVAPAETSPDVEPKRRSLLRGRSLRKV